MLLSIFGVAVCYILLSAFHNRVRPSFVPVHLQRQKRLNTFASRLVQLVHAAAASLAGIAWVLGVFPAEILGCQWIFTITFLIFEMVQNFSAQDSEMYKMAFHHLVTVFFINGWLFNNSTEGLIIFLLSEIPVVCVTWAWLLHFQNGRQTGQTKILNQTAFFTYILFRVIGYPIVFLIKMWPNFDHNTPFLWFSGPVVLLVYLAVYIINVMFVPVIYEQMHKE